jgi:hypothetical protein
MNLGFCVSALGGIRAPNLMIRSPLVPPLSVLDAFDGAEVMGRLRRWQPYLSKGRHVFLYALVNPAPNHCRHDESVPDSGVNACESRALVESFITEEWRGALT